ncbi:hypothetical protein [Treponema endosymbiont of Eucomonympha sp.]|uniref:hypothetical protein n=1 Tax=Treponema endosymbiont of Eucomonympha sp. TaxID=1580831 RepID=UPI001396B76F|nr:hypothetical protein [Treponema endosymbiont of Eucomonympha sp.]
MNEIFHSKLRNISLKSSSTPSNTGGASPHATQNLLFSSFLLFISGVFPLRPPSSPHYLDVTINFYCCRWILVQVIIIV